MTKVLNFLLQSAVAGLCVFLAFALFGLIAHLLSRAFMAGWNLGA